MSDESDILSGVQFQCSICLEVFSRPASLPCGHSFCLACIGGYWDSTDQYQCPLCKEPYKERPKLCINRSLDEFIELFKKKQACCGEQTYARPGEVACDFCTGPKLRAVQSCLVCLASYCKGHLAAHCSRFTKHQLVDPVRNLEDKLCRKHERLLDLFCESDWKCICLQCAKMDHRGHTIVSLEEAVQECKDQLGKSLAQYELMIRDRAKKVEDIRQSIELCKASAERETVDGQQIISKLLNSIAVIQSELAKMIDEKHNSAQRRAEGLIGELDQEICQLKSRKSDMDQLIHTKDYVHFLQSFPSISTLPCTKDWSNITVHTDLSLGTTRRAVSQIGRTVNKLLQKLSETEVQKVQQSAVDVTLDPNTANRWLALSEDGKQVCDVGREQELPDGPERFSHCNCVLGKEGFSSGRHYWKVRVGDKTDWDLGVVSQSGKRKGNITISPEEGYWTLCLRDGGEFSACAEVSFTLYPHSRPQTVGIYVDYEAGQISFYNMDARSHIYTYHGTFTEKLYPLFSPHLSDGAKNSAPLVICPIWKDIPDS